jgi:peptidylprolyl isomerase
MIQAKQGDTVKVHYIGKFDDGKVFYDSGEGDPLEFTIGEGQSIPGLEHAVVGMNPGEAKSFHIEAKEAYGPHHDKLVMKIDRKTLPPDLKPKVGKRLLLHREDGHTVAVTVTDMSKSSITIDANHPLAGEDLTFDIRLIEIT